jgi:two-component system, LytTR family, sensor kinase
LGEFMRRNLERPHEQFVTLDTEIAWARRYIALQQARFGERLEVEYQIADDCLEHPVPTLLLQPLVENAFRHGLSRQNHRCHLRLCADRDIDAVSITVADDGAGLPPGFDVERQRGTGLRNVRSRLAQLYGPDARFEIRGSGGSGTTVTVCLPLGVPALDRRATT